jgi:molybdenum cofactor biosynthesis enzyme
MSGVIYAFEDVPEDLPRPPMAAMRAFLAAGVVLSPRGWSALTLDARRTFLVAGSQPIVDAVGVQAALRQATVSEVRLVPRVLDPNPNVIPEALVAALGPHGRMTTAAWAQLRPVDRYVLATLALNTRLLFRALNEIVPDTRSADLPWKAAVAHVEIVMHPRTVERLKSPGFLDGRAFMLARVAGVRAARRAQETFDLRSERATGPIELDWGPLDEPGAILWQAHVSSWDGAFYPAAALVAASTAAVAIADMVAEEDKAVAIRVASIADEPWMVGGESREQPTTVFSGAEVRNVIASTGPGGPSDKQKFGETARLPAAPGPSAPPAASPSSPSVPASPSNPSLASGSHRAQLTTTPQRTLSKARHRPQEIKTQNSPLLWALFAVLTVVVAALVGVILALLARK